MSELDNEWLTRKQAAELVGVTVRPVQNWIKDCKIKGYQDVGRIRVKRSDVDALYQPQAEKQPSDIKPFRARITRAFFFHKFSIIPHAVCNKPWYL